MKYFLDCEFHEYKITEYKGLVFEIPIPTIELISIGIISENNNSLYLISKDFNIENAWKSHQYDENGNKVYWLRDNVLNKIFEELSLKDNTTNRFSIENFNYLINKYGLSTNEIKLKLIEFFTNTKDEQKIDIFTYYGDYDWVVFAQLFGKMIDLPDYLPMYSKDLKQMLDEYVEKKWLPDSIKYTNDKTITFEKALEKLKQSFDYPKQDNEHNALEDAKWNKKLYDFLMKVI